MINKYKKKSLAKSVLIAVSVIVIAFSISTLLIRLVVLSQKNHQQFEKIVSGRMEILQKSLELPLWNYDLETVNKISKVILSTEFITNLQLKSNTGEILLSLAKDQRQSTQRRHIRIFYMNKHVGDVAVGLSDKWFKKQQHHMLLTGIITLISVVVSLVFAVSFVMKKLVTDPLDNFSERITSISKGDYKPSSECIKYRELAVIDDQFNRMAKEIGKREQSLLGANILLKEEIEERVKVELLLRESEERYRSLTNNISIGIFRSSLDGHFINVNDAIRKMMHLPDDCQVNEVSAANFFPDENDWLKFVELIKNEGVIDGFEIQLGCKDKPPVWVSMSARAVIDDDGRVLYVDGIIEDLRMRKQAEEEQAELRGQLLQNQKMQAVGTLAGGIAHDFNNILTAIVGYTQLATMALSNKTKLEKMLEGIEEAASRAQNLVKQILTFSRQARHEKKAVMLNDIVEETVQLLSQTVPKTIEIQHEVTGTMLVSADQTKIHQVLMNLCTNAYQAMRTEGGVLSINVADAELTQPVHKSSVVVPPGKYQKIIVGDTGTGMDQDTIQQIYEPFFTTKGVGEGTGLGMSVVHGIISEHNGYIHLESQPGKGTVFTIYLPATHKKRSETSQSRTVLEDSGLEGNERILFVDDEKTLISIATLAFTDFGYTIKALDDPELAFKHFLSLVDEYDVLVTDMTMPKMTGLELIEKVRQIKPEMKTYLCSGYSDLISSSTVREQGINGFIEKPYQMRSLIAYIRKSIDSSS